MKIGLQGVNMGALRDPQLVARLARLAEELGYDSVWAADHIALADPPVRFPPTLPIVDPLVSLTFWAANSERLRLATGIIILPQRNPVVLAKQIASLDVLSGGRFTFGIGVGWNEAEMRTVGVQLNERGARADEYLAAMQALWASDKPAYHGRYVDFEGVDAHPRPFQKPWPQLVFGGYSPRSYRRAVSQGHGWYGYGLNVEQTRERLQGLRQAASEVKRPPELGALEITVTPSDDVDSEAVQAFAAAGVHRLAIRMPHDRAAGDIEDYVRSHAPAELGA